MFLERTAECSRSLGSTFSSTPFVFYFIKVDTYDG